jgi:hypothetical protein
LSCDPFEQYHERAALRAVLDLGVCSEQPQRAGVVSSARGDREPPGPARVTSSSSYCPRSLVTGTWSRSATFAKRPAPIRFRPVSYFCTCRKVSPSCLARSVCDICNSWRSTRIRCPTCTSTGSGDFADIKLPIKFPGSSMRECFGGSNDRLRAKFPNARRCGTLHSCCGVFP